jgi:hypothetical protein
MAALSDALPKVGTENKGAAYLLGGMSLIAGVLAAIGVTTDELENMWRNHGFLSHTGIALILIAVALGAIAAWVLAQGSSGERVLLIVGNGLLAIGLILITWAGLELASDRPDPTITAKPIERDGRTAIKVTVQNSKLRADQDLTVAVEPLYEIEEVKRNRTVVSYRVGRPFYAASLAPDKDGNVEREVVVNVPPGNFQDIGVRASDSSRSSCYEEPNPSGCLVVRIPQRSEEPQVSFAWKRTKGRGVRVLRVRVLALDVPNRSLRFRAMSLKPRKRALVQATLASNLDGDVDYTFALPVRRSRIVCIAASTASEPLACPPRDGQNPSWARLRVPGSR